VGHRLNSALDRRELVRLSREVERGDRIGHRVWCPFGGQLPLGTVAVEAGGRPSLSEH
jgi:hypothetical protein